jgi:hypothetical protein
MNKSARPPRITFTSRPPPRRKSSSTALKSIGGDFSVRNKTGMLIEKLSEEMAWDYFLRQTVEDTIELLRQGVVVASRLPKPVGSI